MRPVAIRECQEGAVAAETAYLMPVLLILLMMLFEVARMALVLIIGNLALEAALQSLRLDPDMSLTDDGAIEKQIKESVLDASYGYLQSSEIEMRVTSYADLKAFGVALSGEDDEDDGEDGEDESGYPVVSVEMDLTQEWISALPALVGLKKDFTHTYRNILGNLYQQADSP